jgi:hypothetical protein
MKIGTTLLALALAFPGFAQAQDLKTMLKQDAACLAVVAPFGEANCALAK